MTTYCQNPPARRDDLKYDITQTGTEAVPDGIRVGPKRNAAIAGQEECVLAIQGSSGQVALASCTFNHAIAHLQHAFAENGCNAGPTTCADRMDNCQSAGPTYNECLLTEESSLDNARRFGR